jgi:metal-sulfur cluster biosynthetic enzyme
LLYYLLAGLPLLILVGIVLANRRQARVTEAVTVSEPDVDLTYKPPALAQPGADSAPKPQRDPALAKMSTEDLVLEVLRECEDPEIPLNIVDLGLVYGVETTPEAVTVRMSMTTPECPSHHNIMQDVRTKLTDAGFPNPSVDLVWDPPWTAHRISEEGRKKLGM